MHPIARALMGEGEGPDRDVPCIVCGTLTNCPGFVWASVKLWNRREAEAAQREQRMANLIGGREMGMTCAGECTAVEFRRRHAANAAEIGTTMAYLGMLRAGKYNPESLAWLRAHGHAADVARILATEGNQSHG